MKNKYKPLLILFLFSFGICFAQKTEDWKKLSPDQKSSLIQKMTSDQKMNLLQDYKQDLMVEELGIPDNKKEEFGVLYEEYQNSQRNIKGSFHKKIEFDNLTDDEAQKELDNSFEVGQKLLDNRKEYCKKFQKIIKPQKVLQLFETEGKMRSKLREKSREMQNNDSESSNIREDSPQNRSRRSSGGRR